MTDGRPDIFPTRARLGYVCGALRVTLDKNSESTGPRAHVAGFLGGLDAAGIEPRLFLAGDQAPERVASAGSGQQMSRSLARRAASDSVRLALRYELRRRALREIGDVDVVYERQATFQDLGRPFQRRGSRWIVESNGPFWFEASNERKSLAFVRLAKRLEIEAYRDADLVVAVSDALKEIIVRESGRPPEEVFVLPNATDGRRFDPAAAHPRRLSDRPVIGWLGYMTAWAGVDTLVRAIADLRRSGREVHAVLVGDGPHRAAVNDLVASERVGEIVHFLGHVPWDDVPDLLAGFDLAYSGQRRMDIGAMYHSPQKLYEYQAMALPIIASDYPDARRLIGEADAGWLFAPDDALDLRRAVEEALQAGDLGARGRRARANVTRQHTWEVRVRQLLSELSNRGLLERRRR